MSYFDQREQHVRGNQYNVVGTLNFGAVQNSVDFTSELEKLKQEITRATQEGLIDKRKATDVEYQITKAAQEAEEPKPDKKTIVDHLKTAQTFFEGIVAAGGLVTAITSAIEIAQKIFS